jgi:hypothetical protein
MSATAFDPSCSATDLQTVHELDGYRVEILEMANS